MVLPGGTVSWFVSARMLHLGGKGICSAPREALIIDPTPPHPRAASFGLRNPFDAIGRFVVPQVRVRQRSAKLEQGMREDCDLKNRREWGTSLRLQSALLRRSHIALHAPPSGFSR